MIRLDVAQNSPEWFAARAGIPTASEFKSLLAKGEGKMREKLMYRLAGEIITGQPEETYRGPAMERGHDMEDQARAMYAFTRDVEPERVGFIKRDAGDAGCSPDSFLGSDGGLEIKTCIPSILIGHIRLDRPPPEHMAQVQGTLWVTEREWWDICLFWPGMPLFVKRVVRDEAYIANLASEIARFNEELATVVDGIRRYGEPQARAA